MRHKPAFVMCTALLVVGVGFPTAVNGQDQAYELVDNIFLVDRQNMRIQVFDKDLNYVREFANEGWNPWDIAISRAGDDGFGYIADHATEEVHKIQLEDGKIVATWGTPGRGPGQFDWVHGMAVDSRGGVYAADTYGQRVQKFVPVSGMRTTDSR